MTKQQNLRVLLYAGVSAVALTVAVPELRAADLGPPPAAIYKAAAAPSPIVTMFIEGGALWTGGRGGFIETITDNVFPNVRPGIGWTGAAGIDYQWAGSPWHLNVGFRYGKSKEKKGTFAATTTPSTIAGYAVREEHWVADFMVGRDLGIGLGKSQIKFGLRIADLSRTADSSGFNSSSSSNTIRARSTFFGIGPRVALDGSVPLGGAWNFDYGVGAAALFGTRKYSQDEGGLNNPIEHETATKGGAVFNADVSGALAYWLTPRFKLAVGYQFDGYWKGLLVDVSDDNRQTVNRFYHGPFIRATGKF
jgi:hypothetical protein